MLGYKVAISLTPPDASQPTTIIRGVIGPDGPRLTEVAIQPADGVALPAVDLAAIYRSLGAILAPPNAPTNPPASRRRKPQPTTTPDVAVTTRVPAPSKRSPAKKAGPVKAAAKATTPVTRAAKTTTPAAGRRRSGTPDAPHAATTRAAASGRTYRTMPADFADTVKQTSAVPAIADHYGVPYQTARSWLATHRKRTDAVTT